MDNSNKKRSAGQTESRNDYIGNKGRSAGQSAPEGISGKSRPGAPDKATSGPKGTFSQNEGAENGRRSSRSGNK